MRIWNVLFLMGALALGQGAGVATAQDRFSFAVDGDPYGLGRWIGVRSVSRRNPGHK